VSVWSLSGIPLVQIGSSGSGLGQFLAPYSVCFASDHNQLWVADRNNRRIQLFQLTYNSTSGNVSDLKAEFLQEFGSRDNNDKKSPHTLQKKNQQLCTHELQHLQLIDGNLVLLGVTPGLPRFQKFHFDVIEFIINNPEDDDDLDQRHRHSSLTDLKDDMDDRQSEDDSKRELVAQGFVHVFAVER
jgi:hypothetical protein